MDMKAQPAEDVTALLNRDFPDLCLEPDRRNWPLVDPYGLMLFPTAENGETGLRIMDDFSDEYIL